MESLKRKDLRAQPGWVVAEMWSGDFKHFEHFDDAAAHQKLVGGSLMTTEFYVYHYVEYNQIDLSPEDKSVLMLTYRNNGQEDRS